MSTRYYYAVVVLAMLVVCAVPIRAEVIGPLLPRKAIEVGMTLRHMDRIVEYEGNEFRFTQTDVPLVVRYGISTTATFSLELNGDPFNIEDYAVFYSVGASIQALIWRQSDYAITVGASYARTFAIDPEGTKTQFNEQNLCWTLLGQRAFGIGDQELTLWLGPLISYISVTPQAPDEEDYMESQNLLGGVIGTGLLLVDHVVLQGQWVWVDEPEYRLNLGYRF